jgi:hypothetical protein
MGTPLQDEANRRNGRLSGGRKTPGGKAVSAKNALKHGLLSREVLLTDEDAGAFAQLGRRLGEALDPVGELELVLTERIIRLVWRLRRVDKIEAGILTWQHFKVLNGPHEKDPKNVTVEWVESDKPKKEDEPAQSKKEDEPAQSKEEDVEPTVPYRGYRSQQEADLATAGEAFSGASGGSGDKDALSKLSRYETSIERSLFKTLHELQRLQAARQGKAVAPPLALDIDHSGEGSRDIGFNVADLPGSDAAD